MASLLLTGLMVYLARDRELIEQSPRLSPFSGDVQSNKGGIGKTAAAVNLAYLAAKSGKTTLICDLDSQGATTYYLRVKSKVKRDARGFAKIRRLTDKVIACKGDAAGA